jgi:hypothetical protein
MKIGIREAIFGSVSVILALAVAALPATAEEMPEGPRIDLVAGTTTQFPADSPFHIIHGWAFTPNETIALGLADFRLEIDGNDQGMGSLQNSAIGDGGGLVRLWLYNFHNGLPQGLHTLVGRWFLPCQNAVETGVYPGPCLTPNSPVQVFTFSRTVNFITAVAL